mgnify:FL=1
MGYKRINATERRLIYEWRKDGLNPSEIARRLSRSKSSIYREISRNSGQKGYRYKQEQRKAEARAKRGGDRTFTEEMRQEIRKKTPLGYTPEMIHGRAQLEGRDMVTHERSYQFIYEDARQGGTLWKYLPPAKRKRKRRCPRDDTCGRGKIPNKRSIDTRPDVVQTRERVGDWEGDLINGASETGHLVTLVERRNRFSLIERVDSKHASTVKTCIDRLFEQVPAQARKTLTLDNGKEFALHQEIEQESGIDVYFAHPYHSWERGTNENTNGLIRRIYPKKSSFANIDTKELKRIDRYVNDRPRKCLGWLTPREALHAELNLTD